LVEVETMSTFLHGQFRAGSMFDTSKHYALVTGDAPRFDDRRKLRPGECRWCAGEIEDADRRLRYCGPACRANRSVYYLWAVTRDYVFWRDQGRCVLCGMDCGKVERLVRAISSIEKPGAWAAERWASGEVPRPLHSWWRSETAFEVAKLIGWKKHESALWEVDHILPRESGGGNEAKNLRLLCQPCHRNVTAEYAGLRAAGRKTTPQLKFTMNEGRNGNGRKRKIPSRGFDTRFRRKLDGTFERLS
jgi:5-methylcytosine-specific restriction endonuclease McrA